jgi:hypothetical protein
VSPVFLTSPKSGGQGVDLLHIDSNPQHIYNSAIIKSTGQREVIPKDDWRRQGQERYLKDATLVHRKYRQNAKNPNWDHDHCAFCQAKFSFLDRPDHLKEGYATEDDYHWICPKCFHDFREEFGWTMKE